MSALDRIGADVRALLVERYEQWQRTVPWYRQAPEPVELVPVTLGLERLVRELRADVALKASCLEEAMNRWRQTYDCYIELAKERVTARAELERLRAERDKAVAREGKAYHEAYNANSSRVRSIVRVANAAFFGSKVRAFDPLDEYVGAIAKGYRKARLMLALLQNERAWWRSEALLYREGVTWNVDCLGCAGLLTKLRAAEEEIERSAPELARLRKVEAAARGLVATLPKCDGRALFGAGNAPGEHEQCDRPATRSRGRGGLRRCDEHAPPDVPDYPRAEALRELVALLGGDDAAEPPPSSRRPGFDCCDGCDAPGCDGAAHVRKQWERNDALPIEVARRVADERGAAGRARPRCGRPERHGRRRARHAPVAAARPGERGATASPWQGGSPCGLTGRARSPSGRAPGHSSARRARASGACASTPGPSAARPSWATSCARASATAAGATAGARCPLRARRRARSATALPCERTGSARACSTPSTAAPGRAPRATARASRRARSPPMCSTSLFAPTAPPSSGSSAKRKRGDDMCECVTPEFFTERRRTSKKARACVECAHAIGPGEDYVSSYGKWDGTVQGYDTCLFCHHLRQLFQDDLACCVAFERLFDELLLNVGDYHHDDEHDDVEALLFGAFGFRPRYEPTTMKEASE